MLRVQERVPFQTVIASIIICTHNRCAALQETFHAMELVQVTPGMSVELIVVDNGSTDNTMALIGSTSLSRFELKYFHEPKTGKSFALNKGIEKARGEVLVFTDDDIRPQPDWLLQIIRPILDGQYDAVAGTVRIASHLKRSWMTDTHSAWLACTDYLSPSDPETAVGANLAVARRVLQSVPGFDEELGPGKLGLWEDTLFSLQLKQAGFKLGMAANAIVEHHFDSSRLLRHSFVSHAEKIGRSDSYVTWHWKHKNIPGARQQMVRWQCELFVKRLLRWKDWHQNEGIPVWELNLLSGISFYHQYLKESKRPRAYEKLGIRKIR